MTGLFGHRPDLCHRHSGGPVQRGLSDTMHPPVPLTTFTWAADKLFVSPHPPFLPTCRRPFNPDSVFSAMSEFEEFTETLASLGEEEVRRKLSQGVWANRRKIWAQDWLNNLDASRADRREEKDLALSQEANEIARSALKVSQSAKTISIIAMILSAAIGIIVAVIQFIGQKSGDG